MIMEIKIKYIMKIHCKRLINYNDDDENNHKKGK